uniref:Uncharacterized protein n=1 Tax=Candidatus Kentrum sp. FM TaxID=2126340 RepID=A0A450W5P3_9GAMM|nr:MAG: hypothetical protein BECKFM1743B_GA0114221_102355 [Candidatus Kentron sp. FM]
MCQCPLGAPLPGGFDKSMGGEKRTQKTRRLLLDSGLMADLCNYPSEIDMDGRMFGGEHKVRPYAPPERKGESCIRPLCPIRPYAQKLRLHRAMLYAFRRSTRNPIRAFWKSPKRITRTFLSHRRDLSSPSRFGK